MSIYVHAYRWAWNSYRDNVRKILELARSKSRYPGDVLVFPISTLTGGVHGFNDLHHEMKKALEVAVERMARSLANVDVTLILPVYTTQGLGIFKISNGLAQALPIQADTGSLTVTQSVTGLDYDLVFRCAAFGELFEVPDSSDYILVDSTAYSQTRVWPGHSRVVRHGRTWANYLMPQEAFDVRDQHVCSCDEAALSVAALKTALTGYMARYGFKDVSLGLSGGLDSAVVAAVACDALGPEHVFAYVLPSQYTSEESFQDAKDLAQNLGLTLRSLPIMPCVKTALATLEPELDAQRPQQLMRENLQARVRGLLLMSLSNVDGSLLLTTGNKSELAVGYCTLYGDMCGGLGLLGDIYKSRLYRLCRTDAMLSRVIPKNILSKAPSAELRPDQKDEDSLPAYDVLDKVLFDLIEREKDLNWLKKRHGAQLGQMVFDLVRKSAFKRVQAAEVVTMSEKSLQNVPETFFFS